MTRFYGAVGFSSTTETAPGVFEERTETRMYRGDVTREGRRWSSESSMNDSFTISNYISIIADSFAYDNFSAMRWVEWMGRKWKIASVEVVPPRLTLTVSGLYNGGDADA